MTDSAKAKAALKRLKKTHASLLAEIHKAIVGQEEVIEQLLVTLLARGHCLLTGIPGLGKTLLVKTVAKALDLTFKRIQFTPDLMPADVVGSEVVDEDPDTGKRTFRFSAGPIFANVVLADEINRATPRTQSALLEAMAERQLTVDDITITLPVPFLVIATQNPIELEGTFPLPEAQLDRFMLRLRLGYPTEDEEEAMLTRFQTADPLNDLAAVVGASDITELQETVRQVHLDPVLRNYLVQLVQATRTHADVELGASPRATLGLYRCSQALAAIRGRDYVTPDDLKTLAPLALSHRMILRSQARLRERTPESVIDEILAQIQVPV